jgi:hypothetical protein
MAPRNLATIDRGLGPCLLRRYVAHQRQRQEKRQAHMRFEAFLDPMNNWVVWDTKEQYFAEVGTRYLLSLPEDRAKAFCTMLNILFSKDAGHHS